MILLLFFFLLMGCAATPVVESSRPGEFVSLSDIDPSIVIEMRYAGSHNFVGRPVAGYKAPRCWLTRPVHSRVISGVMIAQIITS